MDRARATLRLPKVPETTPGLTPESRTAREAMRLLVRGAPMSMLMTDRSLRILEVSDRWTAYYRMAREIAVGRSVYEVFPSAVAGWRAVYERCLAGAQEQGDLAASRKADGEPQWFKWEIAPWRDLDGEVGGLMMMNVDVSELVRSRDEAERSARRLNMAVDIADLVVWELSYKDQTVSWSGSADALFGRVIDYEALTSDEFVTVHPDDRERVAAEWKAHEGGGAVFACEYRANREDGREVWIQSKREIVRGADGAPERVIGVLKDITARKVAARDIEHARDAAEAANRAKSQFLANMSHELRTPLNGVLGVAGALARSNLEPAQHEMVSLIESSAQALEGVLSDVLDMASVESGRLSVAREPFDLRQAVHSVAALFAGCAREKGLVFEEAFAPEAEGVYFGDALRLRQILSNLLSNAVKFTPAGGVRLKVAAGGEAESPRLSFQVADTGVGFDPAVKARLFNTFEQSDGSSTREFGGTGLGLSVSRSLAELMGGTLEADALPGRGAVFTLTLDLERADMTASEPTYEEPPASSAAPARIRVLLAEDHPTNRKVVELILSAIDVDLVCVENGRDAVEAFAASAFDVVLMDMQMPVMDGLTAIRLMRARETDGVGAPTPMIVLTANAMPEHVEAAFAAGADAHLAKPVRADALIDAVVSGAEKKATLADPLRLTA